MVDVPFSAAARFSTVCYALVAADPVAYPAHRSVRRGIKRPEREAFNLPPCIVDVKNM